MSYVPFMVDLKDKRCLVIGGGRVAERKISTIVSAHCSIVVIAPQVTPAIKQWSTKGAVTWIQRAFGGVDDLAGYFAVFVATDDESLNAGIAAFCIAKNILVNVAKPGKAGTFAIPSFSSKGGITISVSTAGEAPLLSARLRKELEACSASYRKLFSIVKAFRASLLTVSKDSDYNKKLQLKLFKYPLIAWIEKGGTEKIKKLTKTLLAQAKARQGKR